MVDISHKGETTRLATAVATLLFSKPETYEALSSQRISKGDAIAVARIAAIQAAKKTSDLIPLAHPSLNITGITVDIESFSGREQSFTYTAARQQREISKLEIGNGGVTVRASVKCQGKTGVEMEAITAATMGAVTLYDMLKAIDKGMVIMGARVVQKQGGKSGDWDWDEGANQLVRPTKGIGGPERQGQMDETQTQTRRQESSPLSEVDEWNEGLAAEFSIMDEVEALENERKG